MDYTATKKEFGEKWADAIFGRGTFPRPAHRFHQVNIQRKRKPQAKAA